MLSSVARVILVRMDIFYNHFRTFIPNFKIVAVKQLSYK